MLSSILAMFAMLFAVSSGFGLGLNDRVSAAVLIILATVCQCFAIAIAGGAQ